MKALRTIEAPRFAETCLSAWTGNNPELPASFYAAEETRD